MVQTKVWRFPCVWRSLDKISNEGIFVKLISELIDLIDLIDCLDHITKVRHLTNKQSMFYFYHCLEHTFNNSI